MGILTNRLSPNVPTSIAPSVGKSTIGFGSFQRVRQTTPKPFLVLYFYMNGGAIFTWKFQMDSIWKYYSQRIDSSGNMLWDEPQIYGGRDLISDNAGGAILLVETDAPDTAFYKYKYYIQRINENGAPLWKESGVDFSTLDLDGKPVMTNDVHHGAILSFSVFMPPFSRQVFAQWVDKNGNIGGIPSSIIEQSRNSQDFSRTCFLAQNYPNPFNSSTTIHYQLTNEKPAHVSLKIFSISGKEIVTLENRIKSKGNYQSVWNRKDYTGHYVSTGIYLCQLTVGSHRRTNKMTLLK